MSENTYTLSPIDCRMLDGISELLNKYKFPENKKYSSKLEARLFANEKLTDLVYEEIHINDGILLNAFKSILQMMSYISSLSLL